MRRTLPTLLALLATLTAACKEEVKKKDPVRPVRAMKIGDTRGFVGRSFPGKAAAAQEANLSFEVPGIMYKRLVDKGDRVNKGDLLAALDPRDFQNDLTAARAELARSQALLSRVTEALKANAVSKQERTNAQAAVGVAQAEVRIKQKALEDAKMLAPFDGVVAATYVEQHQSVRAKQEVLRLLDDSSIKFNVGIPENLIKRVHHVKEAWIVFDAYPDQRVPAVISEVGTEASGATRTYPVTLLFTQPEGMEILPGMAGRAAGRLTKEMEAKLNRQSGIVVPATALLEQGGKTYVWVTDPRSNTVSRREVKPGTLTAGGVQVQGKLESGEWIATAGVHFLKQGQRVRLLEQAGKESGGGGRRDSR
jgi:RND family efflux transporter MFP subunit